MKQSLQRLALAVLAVLVISGTALAQTYPQVRINQIVTPANASYGTSGDTRPQLIGDTVTVVGRVIFKSGVSSGTPAGGRDIWIVDTASTASDRLFGGIEVFPDTAGSSGGGPGNANFPQNLNYGDIIAVTGRVFVYPTSITGAGSVFTELVPPNTGASSVQFIAPGSGVKSDASDQPFIVTIDSLKKKVNNVQQNNFAVGQKYEANWLEIHNAYVSSRTGSLGSAWTWSITDATSGNTINIQSRSSLIYGPTTKTFAPPPLGRRLDYIRGVLTKANSSTVVNGIAGGNNYVFEPIDSTDWQVGTGVVSLPPSVTITNGGRTTAFGKSTVSVPLSFKVKEGLNGGTNSNVQVYYAVTAPGASTGFFGPYTAIAATAASGDTSWTATLPAQADGSYVNYFVQATNDSGKTVFSPADTSQYKYFYKIIDSGKPAIQDIEFSPYVSYGSPVAGFPVTITGSVTVNRADSLGSRRQVTASGKQTYNTNLSFYIQDSAKVWSGIEIYQKPSDTTNYAHGTSLTISGTVKTNSNYSTYIDTTYTVTNNGVGTVFAPLSIPNTSTFANYSQSYVNVLVTLPFVTVKDSNSDGLGKYGDFNVASTGNANAAKVRISVCSNAQFIGARLPLAVPPQVEVAPGNKFDAITGIGYVSFGTYKVNPRHSGDFLNANLYAGGTSSGKTASSFSLSQNYPNPFNPSTTISYNVAVRSLVTLKVYDILGREVSTLVNQVRNAGAYEVSFNAARFASGIYFYRLQAGSFVQTKKMVLIK